MINYVPIINWKKGEQDALSHLPSIIQEKICPLLIVPLPNKTKTEDKKQQQKSQEELFSNGESKFKTSILKSWNEKKYYFSLNKQWYIEFNQYKPIEIYQEFYNFAKSISKDYIIPCYNINLFNAHHEQIIENNKKVCIEITINNINQIIELIKILSPINLNEISFDLLINLNYVNADNLEITLYMLQQLCNHHQLIQSFDNIIISSCSFPQSSTGLEKHKLLKFPRYETQVNLKSIELAKQYNFNYIFSDFGPLTISPQEYKLGMQSSFKMRYSTEKNYLFYIGDTSKKGGLEFNKISVACDLLTNSTYYKGNDFSYGDNMIYQIANKTISKSGNLTSWITYSLNHHIELIEKSVK